MSQTNMKPENQTNSNLAKTPEQARNQIIAAKEAGRKKISKIVRDTVLSVGGIVLGLESVGAVATELTDKKPFNDPQPGIVQKAEYDASHPLGWIGNLRINKPIIETTGTTVTTTSLEHTPLILGQNAAYATTTQMQDFIHSTLPPVKPDSEIKTPADLPQIGIIAGIDGKAEWYTTGPVVGTGPLVGQKVPEFLCIVFQDKNAPIRLNIPQGINTDSVELFLRKPDLVNGQPEYSCFYEKFDLGNGEYVVAEIKNDFLPSDFLKAVPIIDPVQINKEGLSIFSGISNQQGKKISITDNLKLVLGYTKTENSTESMDILGTGSYDLPILHLQDNNGTILFSAPN